MTEYELIDAANSTASQAMAATQYALSIVTGYLLIAHFMGRKLTLFQVSFVNGIFILMHTVVMFALVAHAKRVQVLLLKLSESGSDVAVFATLLMAPDRQPSGLVAYVIGGLITLGCLIFMWQVRHPKAG
jgi:hypothetical protein